MNFFKNFLLSLKTSFQERKETLFFKENAEFLAKFKENEYVKVLMDEFNLSFEALFLNQKKTFKTLILAQNDKTWSKLGRVMAKNYISEDSEELKEKMVLFSFFLDKSILKDTVFEYKTSNYLIKTQNIFNFFDNKSMFEFIVYKCFVSAFSMSLIEQKELMLDDLNEIEKAHLKLFHFILSYPQLTEKLVKKHEKEIIKILNSYYNEYTENYINEQLIKPLFLAGLSIELFNDNNDKILQDYMREKQSNIKNYLKTFEEKKYFEKLLSNQEVTLIKKHKKL